MGAFETATLVFALATLVLAVLYCREMMRADKKELDNRFDRAEHWNDQASYHLRQEIEEQKREMLARFKDIETYLSNKEACCPKSSTKPR